ncbi:PKD domain-containing protein [Nocardioides sp. URHA0020]|uniref:PKD domain-containing protein n=1 Tax=Nocardioides sp. URHA0020 TaxID=1380392 RepID=UPI000AEF8C42|nr:PKD domain-containing protein [Nocardioides sp. URHA0020]
MGILVGALATTLTFVAAPGVAAPGHTVLPSATPSGVTPAINNGQVNSIVQVGSTVVVGGTFTSVTPPGGGAQTRNYVIAFDASTGALRTFAANLNGTVQDVMAGPTAGTVYVAGSFTTVNGTAQSHVTLLDVTSGAIVGAFRPAATNGVVNALTMARGRLVLGGNFTSAGGAAHGGLAAVNPTTGAIDNGFLAVDVADRHNDTGSGAQGAVGVRDLEATSSGDKVAVIGNFKHVDGLDRDQLVVLDATTTSASVDPDWQSNRYKPYCFNFAFDTYVRGVAVAPDDSYFVVTATGGQNGGTLCDTAARFEFGSTGNDIQPTWIDYTGGDTLWSVEVTENAVYVGGHQRWMNNSDASDSNGQGSVPRPGLAALDPDSGMPFAWNPGRNPRGAAAFALYASSTGLWVGSDTEWIGDFRYKRPRLAFFPLAGGSAPAVETTPGLPGNVQLGGSTATSQGNVLYRVNAGGPDIDSVDGGPSWTADDGGSNPYRNDGSNAAGWGPGATIDGTVPASTPSAVFDSERWSPSDDPRMSWDFPVANGVPIQVRLFFANRCGCTSSPGSRIFDVDLDGTRVLDDFDIVAAAGDQRGTMRAFDVTSDGNVDIDFAHVNENPLVNAIEIVRRDLPPPSGGTNSLTSIPFDGTTAGTPASADTRGIDWLSVRGAFVVGSTLFYGRTDGYLYRRQITATQTGAEVRIDPYNDPAWSDVDTGSNNTYRGRLPNFYGELSSVTGMAYAADRIYYTRSGDPNLYWRWFSVDSGIVGSQVFTANAGRSWSDTRGLMIVGAKLYVVSRTNGGISVMDFADGSPQGAPSPISTSVDWRGRALFVGPGAPANKPPVASFTASCSGLTCQVDAGASSDPDGSVQGYQWTFGDGQSASGKTASNTYAADGGYTITLTVTDDDGATASTTRPVSVTTPPPGTAISYVGSSTSNANTASPSVGVPGAVQADDVLVLVGSYGADATPATPSGWTLRDQRAVSGMTSFVWTRRATSGDAGASVVTQLPAVVKSALVLTAYRGVDPTQPLNAIASSTDSGTAQHVSPTAAGVANGWTLQIWTDKSSGTTSWTPPGSVTTRGSTYGTGAGRVTAIATDSAGGAGTVGGQTAVTDVASGRGIAWTITVRRAS